MSIRLFAIACIVFGAATLELVSSAKAQTPSLTTLLKAEAPEKLIKDVSKFGDARRGAVLFYEPTLNCAKCHAPQGTESNRRLGPKLNEKRDVSVAHLVESILAPSAKIKKGYETARVMLDDGQMLTGVLVEETDQHLTIDAIEQSSGPRKISKEAIEDWAFAKKSSMPMDLANLLANRQQFLDLACYLNTIATDPSQYSVLKPAIATLAPLPEYESHVDHAGLIQSIDEEGFARGQETFRLRCASCHGTLDEEGSMPTSLRFATGIFKNGNDPYSMYQTLTHGFGMMNPQRWMVPQQKYEVVHYIREHFLRDRNRGQLSEIDSEYLASLPKGDTRGPKPVVARPWTTMDYGPSFINTVEASKDGSNIAQKGIVIRLDDGPGGVESGSHWMMYEHDTMRVAAAWSGQFIDWEGIHFNGVHGRHPKVAGNIHFSNPTVPGFGNPTNGSFDDNRVVGRDGKRYGPLDRKWSNYLGMHRYGDQTVLKYQIGESEILETPGLTFIDDRAVFTRSMNIGPRPRDLVVQIAKVDPALKLTKLASPGNAVALVHEPEPTSPEEPTTGSLVFNGTNFGEIGNGDQFDMTESDFSIFARIKTAEDGTILSQTKNQDEWIPQGKTLFLRNGRPTLDIGWVGAVQASKKVNDNKWHDIVMTWNREDELVRFYVDGKAAGSGELAPDEMISDQVLRIGFTNGNFPENPYFVGKMKEVSFYQRTLADVEIKNPSIREAAGLVGKWTTQLGSEFVEASGNKALNAKVSGAATPDKAESGLVLSTSLNDAVWAKDNEGNVRLSIKSGDEVNVTVSHSPANTFEEAKSIASEIGETQPPRDLASLTRGGPSNHPQLLTAKIIRGEENGPFAVDVFERPTDNPWNCRLRLTGLDFLPDANIAIVSAWDGSIWRVTGISDPKAETTSWQRIACGLFQPLGVKCVGEKIFITCRDQIVQLHDLNGDHEIDWYENFNSDHQVTEHFHEFAMGLQTDDDGNFYYAKSARHAKKAVVPHHGTLLKVSHDGTSTEIIANGFRAANGVCINPDGSFLVTDQEGHWNPKNRINWVRPGEFYGNMFGYHDVTDDSDSAMQDPLCWITNSFDRSPAELLWVTSDKWGPLNGSLLNFSYGYGKVYIVPHESVGGKMQGGMCELPLEQFPTGVMRGRFHPTDGQLYTCGMFAWAGSQQKPGGFYRIRYTNKPVHLPVSLRASTGGIQIAFSGNVSKEDATNPENYAIKTWDLKRTESYGSEHYNEKMLKVEAINLLGDGKTVLLSIPEIKPTWGMEIDYSIKTANGSKLQGKIHNSIFELGQTSKK